MDFGTVSSELCRLGTFFGWPGSDIHCKPPKPTALELAKAGFVYTGKEDEVQCYICHLQVADWERHHDPFVVHATRNPQCPFVLNVGCNIPVFIPSEAAYMKIKSMLNEAGRQVTLAASGLPTTNNDLIYDSINSLKSEGLLSQEPMLMGVSSTSFVGLPTGNSPRLPCGDKQTTRLKTGSPVPKSSASSRQSGRSAGSPPARRSSTSESALSDNLISRPNFQRAKSYAFDPRSARNSETIANRQNSNPGIDLNEYQDSEEARLQTFKNWAGIRGTSAKEFAQAGFIFIGAPDRVQCAFCHGILRNWNDNDVPLEEHRKHFPQCIYVKDFSSAVTVSRPKHQRFRTEISRLNSFTTWDMSKNPKPSDLAKAGFFYVGHGDSVKCFFCDGGLRNWEPNDDPWREHARWFPRCPYVKQSKGHAFIESVLKDVNLTDYQTASVDETELKNIAKATAQRDIDPREITARMDSQIVKTVLQMDVPKPQVREAIKKRLAENGEDFTSAEALLEAIFTSGTPTSESSDTQATSSEDFEKIDFRHSGQTENHDSLKLIEENRLLKEQRQCKICMDEEVCVVFLPCGHLVCCSTCAPALNLCPICRAKIRGTVRTYIS